jgi:hypothetical protein
MLSGTIALRGAKKLPPKGFRQCRAVSCLLLIS